MPNRVDDPWAEFIHAKTVARMCAVTLWSVFDWHRNRHLVGYNLPGSRAVRFKISDVRAMMERGRTTRAQAAPTANETAD